MPRFRAHAGELLVEVLDDIGRITRVGESFKQGWIWHSSMVRQRRVSILLHPKRRRPPHEAAGIGGRTEEFETHESQLIMRVVYGRFGDVGGNAENL